MRLQLFAVLFPLLTQQKNAQDDYRIPQKYQQPAKQTVVLPQIANSLQYQVLYCNYETPITDLVYTQLHFTTLKIKSQ
jgi:hypothetical protein